MDFRLRYSRPGVTLVEAMVTVLIVAVMAAALGSGIAKLLSIKEKEREEAYVREKLADICARYADYLSVASSFSTSVNSSTFAMSAKYRHETGGVSLETGLVTRVANLSSFVKTTDGILDLGIYQFVAGGLEEKLSRRMDGDAELIPLAGEICGCTLMPLDYSVSTVSNGYLFTDAALGYLEVTGRYFVKNDEGEREERIVSAGRVVRLWNKE